MLSARLWKAQRVPWHAFAFWVWLSVFLCGSTFNDLFHSPDCPERVLFSRAARDVHHSVSGTHTVHRAADIECVACITDEVAQAIVPSVHFHVVRLPVQTCPSPTPQIHARESVTSATSRGPPPAVI